ncbi:unnamed protein product [Boreogadus saida]
MGEDLVHDLEDIVMQHRDVFSELPGRTTAAHHDIRTAPGVKRACTGATHGPGTGNVLQLIVISWMGNSRPEESAEGIKQSGGLTARKRPPMKE